MTGRFDKYVESLLTEMPYVSYQTTAMFDFEIETIKSLDELVSKLRQIFSGSKIVDKYGNVLQLQDVDEKNAFWNSLKEDMLFQNTVTHKFGTTIENIEALLD